jgi:small subunit ribosomal protein S7
MPRHSYKRIPTKKDPVYNSFEVAKLINYLMLGGKKTTSQAIVYGVLERFKKENMEPVETLEKALSNVAPEHEVKPRRLGGASYLVPVEVRRERKLFLGLTWIVDAARAKSNKEFRTFQEKLYTELKDAAANQGQAVTKRAQSEKLAEQNKAFSHLKW